MRLEDQDEPGILVLSIRPWELKIGAWTIVPPSPLEKLKKEGGKGKEKRKGVLVPWSWSFLVLR
jgi:hypothetical protein